MLFGYWTEGYSLGVVLEPEKQCPHDREHPMIRAYGSAKIADSARQHLECAITVFYHPVVGGGESDRLTCFSSSVSFRWVASSKGTVNPCYPLSAITLFASRNLSKSWYRYANASWCAPATGSGHH